jgi:hypothetical protein
MLCASNMAPKCLIQWRICIKLRLVQGPTSAECHSRLRRTGLPRELYFVNRSTPWSSLWAVSSQGEQRTTKRGQSIVQIRAATIIQPVRFQIGFCCIMQHYFQDLQPRIQGGFKELISCT